MRVIIYLPGLKTARHSSGVRWSGYDVMVFLEAGAEVPNRALKKGMVIDLRGAVLLGRGVARKIGGRIGLEKANKIRKNRERMEGELVGEMVRRSWGLYIWLRWNQVEAMHQIERNEK